MKMIEPYLGFIFLGLGLVMVFFGSRFILFVFAGLCGLLIGTMAFFFSYNVLLGERTSTKVSIIATLVCCAIIALIFSWLAYKFLKNWAIAIVAAWCGIAIFLPLSKVVGLKGEDVQIGAAVLGALLGFFLGKKFNMYVRSIGTAIIGAFLATRGLGSFLGNYPSERDIIDNTTQGKYNPIILGYVAFMIALAVIGSVVQIK